MRQIVPMILMVKDVLERPSGIYRTIITQVKVLNFLADGQPHGHREIRRGTATSPSTVNKFLGEWTAEGKVDRFSPKKWPKYRITKQGRDELTRLLENITFYNKRRLTSNAVGVTVMPTTDVDGSGKFPILVVVGATAGTPDPLSLQTQKRIAELMQLPLPLAIPAVLEYTKADYIEVRLY